MRIKQDLFNDIRVKLRDIRHMLVDGLEYDECDLDLFLELNKQLEEIKRFLIEVLEQSEKSAK
jgi:hypothetical protein